MLRRCVRNERAFLAAMCSRFALAVRVRCIGPAVTRAGHAARSYRRRWIANQLRRYRAEHGADSTNQFLVNDVRLYINGPVTDRLSSCSIPTTTALPIPSTCWTR